MSGRITDVKVIHVFELVNEPVCSPFHGLVSSIGSIYSSFKFSVKFYTRKRNSVGPSSDYWKSNCKEGFERSDQVEYFEKTMKTH